MTLTQKQLDARKGKLTASRVAVLMNGDREGIMRLYREMIGKLPEEDLSDVWPVQLGAVTEKLNLDWYERKSRHLLTRRGEVWTHSAFEWAAATLDGWDEELKCPVECKHTGGHEPMEIVIDRYQPQMQWQMYVTNAQQCALSVIMGGREPIIDYVPRAEPYIAEMFRRAGSFMMCVDLRTPPVEIAPVPPPIEPHAVVNMTSNNAWSDAAYNWMDNQTAAEVFEDAKKILKSLVPPEAVRCFGHGIKVTRDRAGRLHIREEG